MVQWASVMSQIEAAAFEFASCGILRSAKLAVRLPVAALSEANGKGLITRVDRAGPS